MTSRLIKNGRIVTMNTSREVLQGDIFISDGRIAAIGENLNLDATDPAIDATGRIVLPGFIQTHVHLCQTLLRGTADDLTLLHWLRRRIWPLEAAHDEETIYYSALLGCAELFRCGTTTILDMESVNHTASAILALERAGMRAITGKVMMDAGDDVPEKLLETTEQAITTSLDLLRTLRKRHKGPNGRLDYAFAPRFVLSCSESLLREVARLAREFDVLIQTHASENAHESARVKELKGRPNIEYLHGILTGPEDLRPPRLALAHCVHVEPHEYHILAASGIKVLHCPSSNLKLGSGIAKISKMLDMGICVSLGTDGAPCNNNLDIFQEMRLAALLADYDAGPGKLMAARVLEMATIEGARALGLEERIGSIEVGKRADLCILNLQKPHVVPAGDRDVVSAIVYAAKAEDVETTIIDGHVVMDKRVLTTIGEQEVMVQSAECSHRLLERAGMS